MIDKFTKWIEARPLAKIGSMQIVNFIQDIIFRFRVPNSIITDNGTQFIGGNSRIPMMTTTSGWIECTDHMLVYEPSKPSSLTSTEGGFTPTASMAGSEEKLGTDPQIGQPSCYELCREPYFLGAVALSITVDDFI
jgi:hypothetical protein